MSKKIIKNFEHIKRNFEATTQHNIRYDEDVYRCEIYKYDRLKEWFLKSDENELVTENGKRMLSHGFDKQFWISEKGYKILQFMAGESDEEEGTTIEDIDRGEEKPLRVGKKFNITESGWYRTDLIYAAYDPNIVSDDDDSSLPITPSIEFYVDGVLQENPTKLFINQFMLCRLQHHVHFLEGEHIIEFKCNSRIKVFGLTIRGYDVYTGSKGTGDDLIINNAKITKTETIKADELSMELVYFNELSESDTLTTDKMNQSGYLFDYRDEVNFYIQGKDGEEVQVFGGYISTIKVDENLKSMTLDCAGRLVDGQNRLLLSEVQLAGGEKEALEYDTFYEMHPEFYTKAELLDYLARSYDVPLITQNIYGDNFDLTIDPTKSLFYGTTTADMGLDSATITTFPNTDANWTDGMNMYVYEECEDFVTLRNGTAREKNKTARGDEGFPQRIEIFNAKTDGDMKISPDTENGGSSHLKLEYGMREPKYTTGSNSESGVSSGTPLFGNDCTDTYTMSVVHGLGYGNAGNGQDWSNQAQTGYAVQGANYYNWARTFSNVKDMLSAMRKLWGYTRYSDNRTCPQNLFNTNHFSCNCADAARLVKCCCDSIGHPCVVVHGSIWQGGHYWNVLYVDGEWKTFDLCYRSKGGGYEGTNYSNIW